MFFLDSKASLTEIGPKGSLIKYFSSKFALSKLKHGSKLTNVNDLHVLSQDFDTDMCIQA